VTIQKADYYRRLYDTMMSITVGPDGAEKEYQVYRGLLCYYSDYFDRLLNGAFKEGGSKSLRLKNITVEVFQAFYYWLNTGVVDCSIAPSTSASKHWKKVIEVYVFADYHQARAFQNAIVDYLYLDNEDTRKLAMHVTPFLYANTTEEDKMRKLILDLWVESCHLRYLDKARLVHYEKEFLFDYIVACKEKGIIPGSPKGSRDAWKKQMRRTFCGRYHRHDEPEGGQDEDMVVEIE
jgi:hypothetical protein